MIGAFALTCIISFWVGALFSGLANEGIKAPLGCAAVASGAVLLALAFIGAARGF
jgi:hypothetical protein